MLKGLNAIVTGGDKGLGKAIVIAFASQGANVYFTYNKDSKSAFQTLEEAQRYGTDIKYYQLDLRSDESIDRFIVQLSKDVPKINILVNNAGYINDGIFINSSLDEWNSVIQVIFNGAVKVTRKLLPSIIEQEYGKIINISSIAGIIGIVGQTNYCAAKSALLSFTKVLGKELAPIGVNVNAIAPGYINTDMIKGFEKEQKRKFKLSIPMKRFGKAEEVANAALFLASSMSSYITGQVLIVDGGMI